LKERSHDFFNPFFDKNLLKGFLPSDNNTDDIQGFFCVFQVFSVGLKFELIDFFVLFGKLVIVEVHDVGYSDIAGVKDVNLNAILFGGSEFE
jgi:hypothetical protein